MKDDVKVVERNNANTDVEFTSVNSRDFSGQELTELKPDELVEEKERCLILSILLIRNRIAVLAEPILRFPNLISLDISNNGLCAITEEFGLLSNLQSLVLKNNNIDDDSLPKTFDQLHNLTFLNLSGNKLTEFPPQLIHLPTLQRLYLASNQLTEVPETIQHMQCLEVLNLADNRLEKIPAEFGSLSKMTGLNLASNRLRIIPQTFIRLRNLRSLSLHNNRLCTLPPEIVTLDLVELSLRNNPLVVRFINDMTYNPPSLLELSGRIVKLSNIAIPADCVPQPILQYLNSANKCVNPRCKGVFFTSKVQHVKFVDFCGKYRLPLLQYLCSPKCSDDQPYLEGSASSDESDEEIIYARQRMKRVLLG